MTERTAKTLVFGTSLCVLVLEILAGRLLAPLIGVSMETFTGIIGTILAAIAAGSVIGGRVADRVDPAPLIGPAIVVGGVLTWASPVLVSALDSVRGSDPVTIVILTTVMFFAPAAVLSSVTPMVAKLVIRDLGSTGTIVGGLSAAGTAGALAGTYLTGFLFVRYFSTRTLLAIVGGVLVATGVGVGVAMAVKAKRLSGSAAVAPIVIAVVAASVAGGGVAAIPGRCDLETDYACVELVVDPDRSSGRTVVLNQTHNSYIDLDDPTHLEFRYLRLFASIVTTSAPGSIDGLHLGGAGFTFARYIQASPQAGHQIVLEIDDQLAEFVAAELGPGAMSGVDVVLGDARLTARSLDSDQFDLVIGDAFSGLTVPWHLTTDEFVADLNRVLVGDGVVIMNIIDGGDLSFVRSQLATYAVHFEHLNLVVPPDWGDLWDSSIAASQPRNYVLVASHMPLLMPSIARSDGRWLSESETQTLMGDAAILSDGYAPVDQIRRSG